MNWWEIISAVLGLTCVVLAGRNSKYNFWIGYLYNIFLFILFWRQSLYAAMLLQPVSFAINLFGHWRWTHPRPGEESAEDSRRLKVSRISKQQWSAYLLIVVLLGTTLAGVLDGRTDDPSPWLDSYILMLTFLAQYLSAQKCLECWIIWLVVNAANIALYLNSGLWVMAGVAALYLINGVWSILSWKKLYNKNS